MIALSGKEKGILKNAVFFCALDIPVLASVAMILHFRNVRLDFFRFLYLCFHIKGSNSTIYWMYFTFFSSKKKEFFYL